MYIYAYLQLSIMLHTLPAQTQRRAHKQGSRSSIYHLGNRSRTTNLRVFMSSISFSMATMRHAVNVCKFPSSCWLNEDDFCGKMRRTRTFTVLLPYYTAKFTSFCKMRLGKMQPPSLTPQPLFALPSLSPSTTSVIALTPLCHAAVHIYCSPFTPCPNGPSPLCPPPEPHSPGRYSPRMSLSSPATPWQPWLELKKG